MKWTDDRSGNVEDRRGLGGGAVVGGGLGTLIIAAIIFFLGGDPSSILSSGNAGSNTASTEQRDLTPDELKIREFVQMITAENEETWTKIFAENGMKYSPAKVVLFESTTQSGCGTAQSAMGPFYCPADHKVYMDMSFFKELQSRFELRLQNLPLPMLWLMRWDIMFRIF